jgi:UDP-N-acetylmuramoyl-tripeptide--D-alanyl-D-alanine ligase
MRFAASTLAERLHGRLQGPDVECNGVATDSRALVPGQLFVALRDSRDGHQFINEAVAAGASAYITDGFITQGTAIVVADTAAALTDIGRFARARISGHVVGITGSVGKTTVKDLTRGVFATTFKTEGTFLSYNNEIGLPLTLANAEEDVEVVVAEMGAKGPGHIAELCDIAHPTIGIVTRIGLAHTEYFGSLEAVALGKGELVEALPASGLAVLNGDDPFTASIAPRAAAPVLKFGTTSGCDVSAQDIRLDEQARASFHMSTPWGPTRVTLAVHGAHQVSNALAAATAALWAGVSIDAVAAALAQAQEPPWRMNVTTHKGGVTVVNDAYNANPTSVEAALQAVHDMSATRRIAVLGVMAELGPTSDDEHRKVAEVAESFGISIIGYQTSAYGSAVVSDVNELLALLRPFASGDVILLKGSRVAGMERVAANVVEALSR